MNITIITGSAHRNGTAAYLTEQFIKGAEEAGHTMGDRRNRGRCELLDIGNADGYRLSAAGV